MSLFGGGSSVTVRFFVLVLFAHYFAAAQLKLQSSLVLVTKDKQKTKEQLDLPIITFIKKLPCLLYRNRGFDRLTF